MHILYYQDTMIKSDGAEAPASVQGYIKAVESTRNLKLVDCVSLEASESGNTGAEVYKLYFKRAPVEGAEAEVDNHDLERLVVKMVETHKINFSPAFRAKAMERLIMYLYGYTDARMFKLEINFYQRWKPRFDEIGKQKDGEASMSLFPDLAYAEFHPDTSPFSANKMIWLGWRQKATGGIVMEDLSSKGRFLRATSTEIDLEPLKLMCSAAATFSGRSVRLLKDTPTHRTFQYTLTMMNSGLLLALKRLHFGKGITKKVKKLWGSSMLKILEEDQELIHALEMLETRFSPCKRVFPIWVSPGCIHKGENLRMVIALTSQALISLSALYMVIFTPRTFLTSVETSPMSRCLTCRCGGSDPRPSSLPTFFPPTWIPMTSNARSSCLRYTTRR